MRRMVVFALGFAAVPAGNAWATAAGALVFAALVLAVLAARRWGRDALILGGWLAAGLVAGWAALMAVPRPAPVAESTVVPYVATVHSVLEQNREGVRWRQTGPAGGFVLARWRGPLPRLRPGDRVRVRGVLAPPPARRNRESFDYGAYLRARVIKGTLRVTEWALCGKAAGASYWPQRLVAPVRRHAMERLSGLSMPVERRGILAALAVGEQSLIPDATRETWAMAGAAHLIAVSGLHLACVSALLGLLVAGAARLFPMSEHGVGRRLGVGAAWVGGAAYLFFAGAPTSCVRAWIMLTGYALSGLADREYDGWTWLAVASVLILAVRPAAIREAGFQLSTVSVAAILHTVSRLPRTPAGTPPGIATILGRWLAGSLRVTAAAALATLPFAWYHFGTVPLPALLANLVAVPAVTFVVLPGALALALMPGPWLDGPLTALLDHTLFVLDAALEALALPMARVSLPWPGALAAAVVALALLAALWARRRWVRALCGAVGMAGLVLVAGPSGGDGFSIHFFHVGAGDAALLTTPCGETILIDGGPEGAGRRVLLPYLQRTGKTRLERVYLSHGHDDHWRGVGEVAHRLTICRILTNGSPSATTAARQMARRAAGCDGRPPVVAKAPAGTTRFCGLALDVVVPPDPPSPTFDHENDRSLLLMARYRGESFAFLGDLERADGVPELVGSAPAPLVVKVPHHGRRGPAWLALSVLVRPRFWLVSGKLRHLWRRAGALAVQGGTPTPFLWVTGVHGDLTVGWNGHRWFFQGCD